MSVALSAQRQAAKLAGQFANASSYSSFIKQNPASSRLERAKALKFFLETTQPDWTVSVRHTATATATSTSTDATSGGSRLSRGALARPTAFPSYVHPGIQSSSFSTAACLHSQRQQQGTGHYTRTTLVGALVSPNDVNSTSAPYTFERVNTTLQGAVRRMCLATQATDTTHAPAARHSLAPKTRQQRGLHTSTATLTTATNATQALHQHDPCRGTMLGDYALEQGMSDAAMRTWWPSALVEPAPTRDSRASCQPMQPMSRMVRARFSGLYGSSGHRAKDYLRR